VWGTDCFSSGERSGGGFRSPRGGWVEISEAPVLAWG